MYPFSKYNKGSRQSRRNGASSRTCIFVEFELRTSYCATFNAYLGKAFTDTP